MPYLLVRHTVEDYAKWKAVFDGHAAVRKTSGSRGGYLFRNADSPNEIVVLFEWDDLDHARQFAHSDDLRQAMQNAGVISRPELFFLEEAERLSE